MDSEIMMALDFQLLLGGTKILTAADLTHYGKDPSPRWFCWLGRITVLLNYLPTPFVTFSFILAQSLQISASPLCSIMALDCSIIGEKKKTTQESFLSG